jgi:hypothetical protein
MRRRNKKTPITWISHTQQDAKTQDEDADSTWPSACTVRHFRFCRAWNMSVIRSIARAASGDTKINNILLQKHTSRDSSVGIATGCEHGSQGSIRGGGK